MDKELPVGHGIICLTVGDITRVETDAIVNAANQWLRGGGGVDGAIHRAGGPSILEECSRLGGCATGDAKPTGAGRLPARFVIHAVGPVWRGGKQGEADLLRSAYRRSLEVARELECDRVTFPAISTGVYGYPQSEGARVALETAADWLRAFDRPRELRFVLFNRPALDAFSVALDEIAQRVRE